MRKNVIVKSILTYGMLFALITINSIHLSFTAISSPSPTIQIQMIDEDFNHYR